MRTYDNYIGRVFDDRYEIINVVGSGGSAIIFGVYDVVEDRTAAIKMLRVDCQNNEESIKRFELEAELLSRFSHPGIVKIYDTHLEGFPKYFVMEYVEGITLKKHILSKGAMSQKEIFLIMKPVLSALDEVHKMGVVHSDVKPQNIVVLADGSVRLMDFGISKESKRLTVINLENEKHECPDMAVGTVHYVSPEQAEAKELDGRSDLYSLGVTMYEMATGIPPFFGDNASRIAAMHVNELPIAPSIVNPSVSQEIEEIILRAMEKGLNDRYQTAREMLDAIEKVEHPVPEVYEPLPLKERITEYFKHFSIPSGIAGALCALLVSVVVSLGILSLTILNERGIHNHVKVPKLEGLAYSQIDALGLDPESYTVTAVYKSSPKNSGKILSQYPSAGTAVKLENGEKCEIKVTVAYRKLPSSVPNVSAMTAEDARLFLESYGIAVNVITAPHDFIPKGSVIQTVPAAGEACGSEITVISSSGYEE